MKKRPRHGPLRAVLLLLALLVIGGALLYGGQNHIETEELTFSSPRLPAAFDGLRVVQVSDLHGKEFGPENEKLLKAVAALRPDLIAITGDVIDHPNQMNMLAPLARGLTAIAPTYYVTGNHEWAIREAHTVKALLREEGVSELSNEYLPLRRNGEMMVLAGIDDPNGPYDQKTPEELADEIRQEHGEAYTLLLAHRNEYHETYARAGYDLTLCGHGHGGIIRLPFTDGLIDNTRRRFFPSYTAGRYALEHGELMVSRGLGNVGRTLRVLNRPHLPVIVLKAQ